MYYISICDDDLHYIHYIKSMLFQAGLDQNDVCFYTYNSGEALLNSLNQIDAIDLLILDIQMPGINGNQVARKFRRTFPFSTLVFCSGVYLPTTESFEYTPFRYLLKEYTDARMIEELKCILEQVKSRKAEPYITGRWYHYIVKLRPAEITYISIGKNCLKLHVSPEAVKHDYDMNLSCKDKLSNLYRQLKDYDFEYAHNSYIVNLRYVKRMTRTELKLADGTILSVARSKEETFRLALAKYLARKY